MRHAARADDAVDRDLRLLAGDGVVPAAKQRHLGTDLPAHLARVMQHRLFQ